MERDSTFFCSSGFLCIAPTDKNGSILGDPSVKLFDLFKDEIPFINSDSTQKEEEVSSTLYTGSNKKSKKKCISPIFFSLNDYRIDVSSRMTKTFPDKDFDVMLAGAHRLVAFDPFLCLDKEKTRKSDYFLVSFRGRFSTVFLRSSGFFFEHFLLVEEDQIKPINDRLDFFNKSHGFGANVKILVQPYSLFAHLKLMSLDPLHFSLIKKTLFGEFILAKFNDSPRGIAILSDSSIPNKNVKAKVHLNLFSSSQWPPTQ